MAFRFPIQAAPDAEAKEVIEAALEKMHGGKPPFQWIEESGQSLIGCYAPLSFTPAPWRQQFFELAKLCYSPQGASPRNRELAILGLCSVLDVPYAVYCHHNVTKTLGFSDEQFNAGLAGHVPEGLTEEEAMSYHLGCILPISKGPLDDATWAQVTAVMSKSEFVAILHTIAGYRWVAMLEHANGEDKRWTKSE